MNFFIRAARTLALLLAPVGTLPGAEHAQQPNVLFLFADDQRADTIAALGNSVIQTPNLDRLVSQGVAFDRAYMQGGLHGATCVPSRAMLLTGQSLFRVDEKLLRDQTWPNAFGKTGYTTFMSGKWHNGADSIPASFQIARSIFAGGMTNPMQAKLSEMVDGKLRAPTLAPKHACEVFADEAIRFLKEHKRGPFFCYVPFDAPHDPHIVPDDFPIRYDAARMALPPNFLPQHPWNNGEMVNRDEQLLPWPRAPERVREMNAEYYRYISYLDAQIGRILDALNATPHAKNTIVVFAADSGVAHGSHGLIGKQNVYEHSMRVPLIIAGPGIAAGQRTDAMCYLFDVLPTLGKLCGVPAPKTSEGIEFTASLSEPMKPARAQLICAYRDVQRAIRDDRWKLIRYPQVDKTQLFDLRTDPHETVNLANEPQHAAKVAALMALLEKEQRLFSDSAPLTVPTPKPGNWTPPTAPSKPKPTSHTVRLLEGWTIRIDDRLLTGPDEASGTRALRVLEGKLSDIRLVVPADKLKKLQAVVLVLDLSHGDLRAMQYHPSAGWLRANGYSTDLAKCVHIPQAAELQTKLIVNEQPWVILHELAHAYHDQVLGFELRVKEAFRKFKKSGRGENTLLFDGRRVKHYALTDHKEFFAEMTESYFGVNDFFPFNRAELKEHEPEILDLLAHIWESPAVKPKP